VNGVLNYCINYGVMVQYVYNCTFKKRGAVLFVRGWFTRHCCGCKGHFVAKSGTTSTVIITFHWQSIGYPQSLFKGWTSVCFLRGVVHRLSLWYYIY